METQVNPFEAPSAELEPSSGFERVNAAIYTPGQITAGTFLGGALVGIYFLHRNFRGMDQETNASKTLIGGSILVVALIAILPFLPSRFPNFVIPLAYTLVAKEVANRYQMKKTAILASEHYHPVSNWRVAAETFVGLIAFLILVIGGLFLIQIFRRGL